jgi:hypothetical protein
MGIVSQDAANNAHKRTLASRFQRDQAGSNTGFFRLIITR